jgi:hypothetical protein
LLKNYTYRQPLFLVRAKSFLLLWLFKINMHWFIVFIAVKKEPEPTYSKNGWHSCKKFNYSRIVCHRLARCGHLWLGGSHFD